MSSSPLWLVFLAITSQLLSTSHGKVTLPSLQWDARNPIFRSSARINVLPTSKIMVVCPNPTTVLEPMVTNVLKEEMFENLWVVDKNAFDTCSVDTSKQDNKLLMQCNRPLELKYFTVVFQQFSAVPGGLEFQPGREYYFIATSDGTDASLISQSGGRCKTHNMKIVFYVCWNDTDPKCKNVLPSVVAPTPATVHPSSDIRPSSSSPVAQCSAFLPVTGTPSEFQEMLNNTRLLSHIYKHTEQISDIFGHLRNMSAELEAVREKLNNCSFGVTPTSKPSPTDLKSCQELYNVGFTTSGIYTITPNDGKGAFQVFCDQVTAGGGWTMIQKRFDGSLDFYRNWTEYEAGFGALHGEFWLGLDKIHRLTATPQTLRFDLGAPDGETKYEEYQRFSVQDAASKYKLLLGPASGTAKDSFSFQKNQKFSTYDQDNDQWKDGNCAATFPSGWWHNGCHKTGMNGLYSKKPNIAFGNGIIWVDWKGYKYGLTKTEMKVRL